MPHPWLFLATWLAGGALAFGRLAAFLTGWTSFVAGFSGAIAASAVVFAFYLGRFVPAAASGTPLIVVPIP